MAILRRRFSIIQPDIPILPPIHAGPRCCDNRCREGFKEHSPADEGPIVVPAGRARSFDGDASVQVFSAVGTAPPGVVRNSVLARHARRYCMPRTVSVNLSVTPDA